MCSVLYTWQPCRGYSFAVGHIGWGHERQPQTRAAKKTGPRQRSDKTWFLWALSAGLVVRSPQAKEFQTIVGQDEDQLVKVLQAWRISC